MVVLSHFTVAPMRRAHTDGLDSIRASLDLGRTLTEISLDAERVRFPDGQLLAWSAVEEIESSDTVCFLVENGEARRIQLYSAERSRFYGLRPTTGAPTMILSGIPMHRFKGVDPLENARGVVRTISAVTGRTLDICTGLGYTAITAAATAQEVITIELDSTVLELARMNPWSKELFESPCIKRIIGDAFEEVEQLEAGGFARIVHDPPTFKLAGELYSGEMYRRLHRLLRRGGRLFHYIGDLNSTTGRVVARGVARRLQEAGFERITRRPEAFGLTAEK